MLRRLIRSWRYGEPVIVVSGLPRSGTSMLMSMLQAGGVPVLSDSLRVADADNPHGYFELDRVKRLAEEPDRSWVRQARGKALKVISHLLKELPPDNFYRVVFAQRDLEEIVASQNAMLRRLGTMNPVDDHKALDLYRRHLVNVKLLMRTRPNFEMLTVPYVQAVREPLTVAGHIAGFLGGRLDVARMAGVVDPQLYRNRGT
jgi:hypothetical protein